MKSFTVTGWMLCLALFAVAIFSLHLFLNHMERQECHRWAEHPSEVSYGWQIDQCKYHNIPLQK